MTVFISYNHNDESFAIRLGKALISNNVPVWLDKWQLGLGDSLTNKIQDGLEKASFICIVLSRNALQSEWVKREITASLIRELEENKLTILPLLLDDCTIPLFLRDKQYADFSRISFEKGLEMIISAVSEKYNLYAGKFTNKDKSTSFGTDMMISDELITFNLDIISADDDYDYFILTKIKIVGDKNVLEQFKVYKKKGESERFIRELMESCSQAPEISETRLVVGGAKLGKKTFSMQTKDPDLSVFVDVTSKKIGTDDGKFVVVNLEALLNFFVSQFELKT